MVLVFAYFMRVQLQVVFFEVKCKPGVPIPKCMSQPARRLRTCLEAFCGFLVSDNNESDSSSESSPQSIFLVQVLGCRLRYSASTFEEQGRSAFLESLASVLVDNCPV